MAIIDKQSYRSALLGDTGQVTQETMKRYPALTFAAGFKTTEQNPNLGPDVDSIIGGARTSTSGNRLGAAADGLNSGFMQKYFGMEADLPKLDSNLTGTQVRQSQLDILGQQGVGQMALMRKMVEQTQEAAKLNRLDREMQKKEKLAKDKTLQSFIVEDAAIRSRALVARSRLRPMLADLSPSARQSVLSAQAGMFRSQQHDLERLKNARIGAIESAFDSETDALDDQLEALEDEADSYSAILSLMNARGSNELAKSKVLAAEAKALDVLRKKKGDHVTREELTLARLIEENPKADKEALRIRAKQLTQATKEFMASDDPALSGIRGAIGMSGKAQIPIGTSQEKGGFLSKEFWFGF